MAKPVIFFVMGMVLFLFGMLQLSTGVQKMMSGRIRSYIRYSVRKPIYGMLVGALSTILLQSSTATTVITVGIVGAGLITFYHSLGILLGADIGTTLTVQLVVWKVTAVSPLLIILGGSVWIAGREKWKPLGAAVFYFGLMFFGLEMTSQATGPLKENADIISFLKEGRNPLLGLLAGVVFTAIVQASAVPISILVILAQQGLIGIENAIPVVFGANIGTTATVLLAGLTTNKSGKRTALAHLLFKVAGVAIALAVMPVFIDILGRLSAETGQQIALGHFLLNALILLFFIPILKPVSALIEKMVPGKEEVLPLWPEFLDESRLAAPEEALECVRKELKRELMLARRNTLDSLQFISDYKEGERRSIFYIELVIDNLRAEIVSYLWKVSSVRLSQSLSTRLFAYTAMVDDIERIADHAVNLADLSRQKHRRDISFTDEGNAELQEMIDLLKNSLEKALELIERRDMKAIDRILDNESKMDRLVKESRDKHLERFFNRISEAESGPIFVEILINLERISDHCENIAQSIQDLD